MISSIGKPMNLHAMPFRKLSDQPFDFCPPSSLQERERCPRSKHGMNRRPR